MAAAAAQQLPNLMSLLESVVSSPPPKAQHHGEALKSCCAILEAMRRLLPAGSFSAAAGPGKRLADAVHDALDSQTVQPSSKVCLYRALERLHWSLCTGGCMTEASHCTCLYTHTHNEEG